MGPRVDANGPLMRDVLRFKDVELSKDGETEGEMCEERPLKPDAPVSTSEDEANE